MADDFTQLHRSKIIRVGKDICRACGLSKKSFHLRIKCRVCGQFLNADIPRVAGTMEFTFACKCALEMEHKT